MAKIVLLVGLFALAALQLSQAAPRPEGAVVEVKSPLETQPPVPTLKSDDPTGNPSATTFVAAAKTDVAEVAATTEVAAPTKA